ncbi:MAG: TrkH family potassium uptake protein, partial [Proteobacteria bacterium]|nr:TrkH family potassium uptake protein [Pseudomonadota bacterium]
MRHAQVLNALAIILGIFALTMFVPLGISWYYQDGAELAYDEAIVLALGSALLLWLATRRTRRDLTAR